jgi:uncharacterized protein YktB (UPF0637 family)
MNLEMNGKESIKDFETFIEKAKTLTESTKKSSKKLTKTSAKKVVRDYEKHKKNLVTKSKTAIIDLIKYLKKINVPEFLIIEYVLMPEDVSLNETNDLLKSYELIIKGLEELVLNPPPKDD